MKPSRAALSIVLLVGLTGCRFSGVPAPEPWPRTVAKSKLLKRARDALPLDYRVGVLPLRVDYDPRSLFADDPARNASIPDLEAFRAELVNGLEDLSLFRRVAPRGEEGATRDELSAAAWNARDDLVLECVLRSYHQEYLGHTAYLTWFLVYSTYVWPAWFVPVDSYGGGLEMHVRLRSVQAEAKPLLEFTYVIKPEEAAQEFTPNDRELAGFLDIGALWNVETSLEDSNWRAIERGIGPYVRRELLLRMAQDVEAQVAHPLRSGPVATQQRLLQGVRKRFGLVVGISDYADPAVGSVPHGAQDARAVAQLLASPQGGGLIEGRDLTVLEGEQATRSEIVDALESIASRATPTDEVIIYYSGFGSSVARETTDAAETKETRGALGGLGGLAAELGDAGVLLPQDTRAADLTASTLSLRELGHLLDAIPTCRVVLLLDTSFTGQGPRTFHVAGRSGPTQSGLVGDMRLASGRAALLAAAGPAHDLPEIGAGLFTHVLLAGISGEADADQNAHVTLQELADYATEQVPSRAGLEGLEQTPRLIGSNEGTPLTWPR